MPANGQTHCRLFFGDVFISPIIVGIEEISCFVMAMMLGVSENSSCLSAKKY